VQYAKDTTNNIKVAREFNLTDKLVSDWQKCAAELQKLPKTKKACCGHPIPPDPNETTLCDRKSDYIDSLNDMGSDTTDIS